MKIKTKILLVLCIIAITAMLCAISISATEPVETWDISETEEDSVIAYLYDDPENEGYYTLKITGTGDMKHSNAWYYSYKDKITMVSIGNGVTSIGCYAFQLCTSLTSVTISNSVTSINYQAFDRCTNLANVDYLGDVKDWCNINFNTNVTSNPLYYGGNLYLNGELATEIVIPNTVKEIKSYAFHGCKSLVKVEIENSVTSIGSLAFSNCANLTSIEIANSVTSIGQSAFRNCTSLESVTIPNSVISIDQAAFCGCKSLGKVEIENGVTSIGSSAFSECIFLTSLTIPSSVTSIGSYAFSSCSRLERITIPKSVTSIGYYPFYNCTSITIYCEAESQPSGWDDGWNLSKCPVVWDYKNTKKNDVFTFKGYSFGALGQISFGFDIDYEAKALYEELTDDTLEMGVVFAGYDNLGGNQPLDENGGAIKLDKGLVIKFDLSEYTYSSYDFMLFDISDSISDIKLVIAAYMYDGDVVKYVQENGISDTVSGISYNEAKAK